MKKIALMLIVSALLAGACFAQARDPASPKVGNKDRGRELLAVLGPRPNNAVGITPLQQQELSRRVRCAATRQEIQDELDFEAAGSKGFYPLMELRAAENAICTPPPQLVLPSLPAAPSRPEPKQPPPPPHAMFQSPPQRAVTPPAPTQSLASQPTPPQQAAQAPPRPAPPPQPLPPPKPVSTAPAYTPAPNYPKEDLAAGHEGIVMVQLVMNADGSVHAASVAQSSNYPTLDAAALEAARTWRIPAAGGRTIKVPLTFSAH
jgi:TonB family protein